MAAAPIGRRGVAGLGLGLLLGGCSQGMTGMEVPAKGRMLDVAVRGTPAAPPGPVDSALRDFLLSEHGVLEDNALSGHCRRVLGRLLAAWPGTPPAIAVWIVPKPNFTAEASRDGAIMLTTGTFDHLLRQPELQSEDVLAFILAHEAAHVLLGHARDRSGTQDMMHRVSGLLFVGTSIAGRMTGAGADAARIAQHVLIGNQLGMETLDATLFPGWNRAQEYQADALACDLMARAGYSLQAVPQVIAVLEAVEAERARHAGAAPELMVVNGTGVRIQVGDVLRHGLDRLRESHPGAADRKAQIGAYIEREWPDELVEFDRAGFRRIAGDRTVQRVMSDSAAAAQALGDLVANRPREGLQQLAKLDPQGSVNASAMVILARMLTQGVPPPLSHPRATLAIHRVAAMQAERANRLPEALQIYAMAQERFDQEDLLVNRIQLLRRMDRKTEAQLLALRCATSGRTGLQEACVAAAR